MEKLTNEFQKVSQTLSENKSTIGLERYQNDKNKSEKTNCSCNIKGANGLQQPCDLVPLDKRLPQLKTEFYKRNVCTCEGLEYVSFHLPITHQDFGKVVPCLCTISSQTQSRKEILVKASNLNERKLFEDFDVSLNPDCKHGLETSKKWVTETSTPMVILYGQAGVGKTHLAVASAWGKLGMGKPTLFYTASELIRELQSGVASHELENIIGKVKSAQNLILDDLGREYSTDWTSAIFHEIIDYRYNNSISLNTLITTNHSFTELEKIIGVPAVSRFTDIVSSTVVIMDGKDVRMAKR